MQMLSRWMFTTGFLLLLVPGCPSTADQRASDGLDAFKRCDLRSASQDFESAHALDSSRADFALAYALSTLATLPEDPAVTKVLGRLGFDGPIDMSVFWGTGGVLDQLRSGSASCQSVSDFLLNKIPYKALQKDGPSAASLLHDESLTGDDFVAAAAALSPRLERIVEALEQAAAGMPDVDIEGGCGLGTIHIQAPELYGFAATIELFRAAIQVAEGYDWAIEAKLLLDTSNQTQGYVDALNAHVLHVKSKAAVEAAAPIALHAVELVQHGLTAAAGITSRPPHSLFDWSRMPVGTLADLQQIAGAAHDLLSAPGAKAIPFLEPALSVDARSFFDAPVDVTNVAPPIWSYTMVTDPAGGSYGVIQTTSDGLESQVAPRFTPDPFGASAPSFTLTLSDKWKGISSDAWIAVFDPDRRWDKLYTCTAAAPLPPDPPQP